MNERILEAIKTLKKHQDLLQDSLKEINDKLKKLEDYKDYNESTIDDIQKSMIDASLESGRYSIIDGEWCYYGKPMGVKAIGIDGKDGKQGLQGIPGKDGKDGKPGKDGKDGKNGLDGKPGKDGKNGLDGKPGKDGTDGETPTIRIGKVESSEENGGAKAVLKRKKGTNEYILDLTLPRGPRGFAGFDGKPGKDATGVDIDLSEYAKKTEIPDKTSQLTNDSKYITNNITTDFNLDGKLYLNTVGSSVNTNSSSRIVFGNVNTPYSWIASNSSGAFAFSKGSGNILVYPKTGQYNCLMTDCESDLGRTDKFWKNLYLNGTMSDGTNSVKISEIANKNYVDEKIGDIEALLKEV